MRIPRFIQLATVSLFIFTGAITAVALPRRSAADALRYCLQLRTPDDRRHLIDIRSGDRAYLSTDRYKVQMSTGGWKASHNGAITAYVTQQFTPTSMDDFSYLWLDGAGISSTPILSLPEDASFRWLADRLLFVRANASDRAIAGGVTVQPDGQIVSDVREFNNLDIVSIRENGQDLVVTTSSALSYWSSSSQRWFDIPLASATEHFASHQYIDGIGSDMFILNLTQADQPAFRIVDPQRGIDQILSNHSLTARDQPHKFVWSHDGNSLAVLIDSGLTQRVDIWSLHQDSDARQFQLVETQTFPNTDDLRWLWSADGKSAVYATLSIAAGRQLVVRRHFLNAADEHSAPVLISARVPSGIYERGDHLTFVTTQDQGFNIFMIGSDGTMITLARNLAHEPDVRETEDYLNFNWSVDDVSHLLLINPSIERSIELLADNNVVKPIVAGDMIIGDVWITAVNESFGTRYLAINLNTFQPVILVEADQEIIDIVAGNQSGSFVVRWTMTKGVDSGLSLFDKTGNLETVFVTSKAYFKETITATSVSPDGTAVVFAVNDAARDILYLVRTDNQTRALTIPAYIFTAPTWSPDSQFFSVLVYDRLPQNSAILIFDAEGNLIQKYPASGAAAEVIWKTCQ